MSVRNIWNVENHCQVKNEQENLNTQFMCRQSSIYTCRWLI